MRGGGYGLAFVHGKRELRGKGGEGGGEGIFGDISEWRELRRGGGLNGEKVGEFKLCE